MFLYLGIVICLHILGYKGEVTSFDMLNGTLDGSEFIMVGIDELQDSDDHCCEKAKDYDYQGQSSCYQVSGKLQVDELIHSRPLSMGGFARLLRW